MVCPQEVEYTIDAIKWQHMQQCELATLLQALNCWSSRGSS